MNKLFITIVLTLCGLLPSSVLALEMSFEPANVASNQEKAFTATLVVNTDGESINAVDGTLSVAGQLADGLSISDSGSIVTYWVKPPTYDKATNTIQFSGTIPGGYEGQAGILFSIILPPYSGPSLDKAISIGQATAYINDGLGTQAKVQAKQFAITSQGSGPVDTEIASQLYLDEKRPDNVPPEVFSPQLAQDDRVFDGQWFVNFATTDKQSGIAYYEIQETRSGALDAGRWKRAQSPYLLEDQDLHSYIYIVAVDRQGNERMIRVNPRRPLGWWQLHQKDLVTGGVVVLIIFGSSWYVLRTRQRKIK